MRHETASVRDETANLRHETASDRPETASEGPETAPERPEGLEGPEGPEGPEFTPEGAWTASELLDPVSEWSGGGMDIHTYSGPSDADSRPLEPASRPSEAISGL